MTESAKEDDLTATQNYFAVENTNTESDDDFDKELYADLTMDRRQEMDYNELKKLYDESKEKAQELTKENQELREQNNILKKNISCLYLTAKEEIQRKDAQLKSLQDKEVRRKQYQAQRIEQNKVDNLQTLTQKNTKVFSTEQG